MCLADDLSDARQIVSDNTEALSTLLLNPMNSIPTELLHASQCVISLHILKIGLVWGARIGRGLVSCRTVNGAWSSPLFIDLGSASWGLQIGIEVVDLNLVFTNANAAKSFQNGNLTLDAGVGLAIGPVGRDLTAGTNYSLIDSTYSYSRTKGLYVGFSLEGSIISPDTDLNKAAYGQLSNSQILNLMPLLEPVPFQTYTNVLSQYSN